MFDLITNKANNVKNDVLSGITVALALVPEAVHLLLLLGFLLRSRALSS
jgi:MFS superfamily sulfate permease-like transporter